MNREPSVVRDLIVKFLIVAAATLIGLTWLGHLSWLRSVNAAVWVTLVNYVIGDLIVLRWGGRGWASFTNFLAGALTLWLVTLGMRVHPALWTIWFTAVLVGLGEHFYHQFLGRVGYHIRSEPGSRSSDDSEQ